MARLFDSYVMVDWSAASKPATGADSIWIGALTPDSRLKLAFKASNPPTRARAIAELEDLLGRCMKRGDRVLMGVDFPLGFPAGTAEALKLKGAPWRAIRDFLLKEMKDKPDNSNNRFALAARMNRLISSGPFPFWGCSKKDELTTLSVRKSREHGPGDVPEYRIVENAATGLEEGAAAAGVEDRVCRRHRRPDTHGHSCNRAPAREISRSQGVAVRNPAGKAGRCRTRRRAHPRRRSSAITELELVRKRPRSATRHRCAARARNWPSVTPTESCRRFSQGSAS